MRAHVVTQHTPLGQLRPVQHLHTASRLYPQAWSQVEDFRASRGQQGIPRWPDWCFMPMGGWHAIVSASNGGLMSLALSQDIAQLSALGTWRYSQGIYRVAPEMLQALADSPISGNLPSEVLYRLPEWCVYVEAPALSWHGDNLSGFWAHLEWDVNTQRSELRLLLDGEQGLHPVILHLGPWTIEEACRKAVEEGGKQAERLGLSPPSAQQPQLAGAIAQAVTPMVSVLLYLCSKEPDIDHDRVPGTQPRRPQPKKTKKGFRLFPPDKPNVWRVGETFAAEVRRVTSDNAELSGRSLSTHLRRGHWHGYWLGPRSSERVFEYRWISPLVVKGRLGE